MSYTIDLCTGGTATASSTYSSYYPSKAFDDDINTFWSSNGMPCWIKYDFGSGNEKIINKYTLQVIYAWGSSDSPPEDFKFQGSNNDSDWTDLDIVTGETGWSDGEIREFTNFSEGDNATSYRYYRIYISKTQGNSSYCALKEIEMMAFGLTVDTTATTDISQSSAILNGNITDIGSENADERGFVYDTTSHGDPGDVAPASSDYASNVKETGDYGTGVFNLSATDLDSEQTYYARAYAHNSGGYSYGDEVSFNTLEPYSFGLGWLVKKIYSFGFEWLVKKIQSSSFGFSWVVSGSQRRYNLLTYPLFLKTPTVSSFTFSASVTGTLDSLAVDFSNTGSSGSTIIKIYLADILEYTYTVTANNLAKNETITLSDNNISLGDKIRVEIESVATGIGTLHIAVQEKTFTERLKIIKKCNVFNDTEYEDEIFYGDASEWRLYINQPLYSIVKVYAKSGTDIFYLSAFLDYGDIKTNYISITPDTITNYDELIITSETVIDKKIKEIVIPLRFYEKKVDYPDYVYSSFTMDVYLSAIKLYYSWDNITWYSTDIDRSKITISNLPTTSGTYTFYTRYFYDLEGKKVISDTKTIIYNPDPIDVYIDQNIVNYSDSIPPAKVEIYADDVLEKQVDIPCTISGFGSYSFDSSSQIITLEAGDFYEKETKYTFAQQTFTITDTPTFESPLIYYVIGFNTTTKLLELKKITYESLDLTFEDLTTAFFVPIWQFQFNAYFSGDDFVTGGIFEIMDAEKIFYPVKLPIIYGESSTKYRVYDVLGRYRDIEFNNTPTKDDYLYYLVVTDSESNELKQGEITQETTLTFTVEELE